jgi:hypothetical protein
MDEVEAVKEVETTMKIRDDIIVVLRKMVHSDETYKAYYYALMCKCNDIDRHALHRKCCLSNIIYVLAI